MRLVIAEKQFRHNDPTWKLKEKRWREYREGEKQREKQQSKLKKSELRNGSDRLPEEDQFTPPSNPYIPDPNFSFFNEKTGYTLYDLQQDIQSLPYYSFGRSPFLMRVRKVH